MTLTVGSLFSGIGGLDLGLERAGMKVVWQSEIEPYACKILNKHWPDIPNHGDIKKIDWTQIEKPNIICGGYPCQPFSTAGKRSGEKDSRHLWPWVRTAISELRPDYAILENVRGHLSLGGLSVIGELAAIGYDCEWRIVSAASVGANHRRDRLIIVAYPNSASRDQQYQRKVQKPNVDRCCENVAYTNSSDSTDGRKCEDVSSQDTSWGDDGSGSGSDFGEVGLGSAREDFRGVAYPNDAGSGTSERRHHRIGFPLEQGRQDDAQSWFGRPGADMAYSDGGRFEECKSKTKQEVRSGVSGKRVFAGENIGRQASEYAGWEWWETEPDVGRVADGVPSRVDRLRGLGNSVVPQMAEIIGRLVVEHYDRG